MSCKYSVLFAAWTAASIGCGVASETSETKAEASPQVQVRQNYTGLATVTAEPTLNIRTAAASSAPILRIDGASVALMRDDTVFVRSTRTDASTGRIFADIGFGWVDARYLAMRDDSCARSLVGPFSHAFTDRRTNAVLSVVGFSEGTGSCYNLMFGYETFASYAAHPNVCRSFGDTCSTAAGRYQFLKRTWDVVREGMVLADFAPAEQDRGALYLFENRGFRDHAASLGYSDFKEAIELISWEWASLPPGRYGQPIRTMDELWGRYRAWTNPDYARSSQ
jgi:muramidase (phage lysozyme)